MRSQAEHILDNQLTVTGIQSCGHDPSCVVSRISVEVDDKQVERSPYMCPNCNVGVCSWSTSTADKTIATHQK